MELGKKQRLKHIWKNNHRNIIIVPMDHGFTMGPIPGICDMKETIVRLSNYPVDAFVLHKGMIYSCAEEILKSNIPIIMHLSAGTNLNTDSHSRVIVGSVQEAISFGCDAVSVQIGIGDQKEGQILIEAARVAEDCYRYGMPLMAMIYGKSNTDKKKEPVDLICHAARVGLELGADFIKVNYSGSSEKFQKVVKGSPVPIIIAGGEKHNSEEEFILLLEDAMKSGVQGVAIGRNIFQSSDMDRMIQQIDRIVHGNEAFDKMLCNS